VAVFQANVFQANVFQAGAGEPPEPASGRHGLSRPLSRLLWRSPIIPVVAVLIAFGLLR
jgi:hypothetical protein